MTRAEMITLLLGTKRIDTRNMAKILVLGPDRWILLEDLN